MGVESVKLPIWYTAPTIESPRRPVPPPTESSTRTPAPASATGSGGTPRNCCRGASGDRGQCRRSDRHAENPERSCMNRNAYPSQLTGPFGSGSLRREVVVDRDVDLHRRIAENRRPHQRRKSAAARDATSRIVAGSGTPRDAGSAPARATASPRRSLRHTPSLRWEKCPRAGTEQLSEQQARKPIEPMLKNVDAIAGTPN